MPGDIDINHLMDSDCNKLLLTVVFYYCIDLCWKVMIFICLQMLPQSHTEQGGIQSTILCHFSLFFLCSP